MTVATTSNPAAGTQTAEPATRPGKSIASLLGSADTPVTVSGACRLSESTLWDRQRRFYATDGAGIWGTATVPHFITSNPSIASSYARIALAVLRQTQTQTQTQTHAGEDLADAPHIVEVGGGSGRFAYLFVQQLRTLAPDLRFVYILTDFAPDRLEQWRNHPSFRPHIEDGFIDFAVLDADQLAPLQLMISGRTLRAGSLRGALLGVANYVFDTLRQDSYAIRGGQMFEYHLTLELASGDHGLDADAPLALLNARWDTAPCAHVTPDVQLVLDYYAQTLDDTAVLVPVGAMRCLEFLDALSSGPSCVLAADKGHRNTTELCSQEAPAIVPHGEGFSVMVNFDFLARWNRERGGAALMPCEPARSLVVAAFTRGEIGSLEALQATFDDELVDIGPDNYHAIRAVLTSAAPTTIESLLACVRFSRWDPAMFLELFPALLEAMPSVPEPVKGEVHRTLCNVWRHYFPIGEPIDLALCIGFVLSAMSWYPEAIEFFDRSVTELGTTAESAFAMAAARYGQRNLADAREWVDRALVLEPGFSEARTLRATLRNELNDERSL